MAEYLSCKLLFILSIMIHDPITSKLHERYSYFLRHSTMRGPTLSPVASLCFTCAASHIGNVPERQHRQKTCGLSSPDTSTLSTTLASSLRIDGLMGCAAQTPVERLAIARDGRYRGVANTAAECIVGNR